MVLVVTSSALFRDALAVGQVRVQYRFSYGVWYICMSVNVVLFGLGWETLPYRFFLVILVSVRNGCVSGHGV